MSQLLQHQMSVMGVDKEVRGWMERPRERHSCLPSYIGCLDFPVTASYFLLSRSLVVGSASTFTCFWYLDIYLVVALLRHYIG